MTPLRNQRLLQATHFNVEWAESNLLENDNTVMTARAFYGLLAQIRMERDSEQCGGYCKVKFQPAARGDYGITVSGRSYRIDVTPDFNSVDLRFACRYGHDKPDTVLED